MTWWIPSLVWFQPDELPDKFWGNVLNLSKVVVPPTKGHVESPWCTIYIYLFQASFAILEISGLSVRAPERIKKSGWFHRLIWKAEDGEPTGDEYNSPQNMNRSKLTCPQKRDHFKRKVVWKNHHFWGASLVFRRVSVSWISQPFVLNKP